MAKKMFKVDHDDALQTLYEIRQRIAYLEMPQTFRALEKTPGGVRKRDEAIRDWGRELIDLRGRAQRLSESLRKTL